MANKPEKERDITTLVFDPEVLAFLSLGVEPERQPGHLNGAQPLLVAKSQEYIEISGITGQSNGHTLV